MSEWIEKHSGLSTAEVGKAALMFKASSWLLYLGGIALCYRFKPLRRIGKWPRVRALYDTYEFRHERLKRARLWVLAKAEQVARSKYFAPIPAALGLKGKRLTLAIAENIVLYKVTLPITVPLQLWFIVKYYRGKHDNVANKKT